MNEVVETLKRYICDECNLLGYFGENSISDKLFEAFSAGDGHEYEAPDYFVSYHNEIWIIEHFEFDKYESTKKGSGYKRELDQIERSNETFDYKTKGMSVNVINSSSSYKSYVENAKRGFKKHYKKIEKYKRNLISEGYATEDTKFFVLFLIDDVSPLGALYLNEQREMEQFLLAESREFLQLVKESPLIDGILTTVKASKEKVVWFIDRHNIDEYLMNAADYENRAMLFQRPLVIETIREIRRND